MGKYKIISADTHIVEPPDMFDSRIDPKFRDQAPRMERRRNSSGNDYDAWFLDGIQIGSLGQFVQAGRRFDHPDELDLNGVWEDMTDAAHNPHSMLKALELDGVWGACLQPSQGLTWYRIPGRSELLSAINHAYNDWIADFCTAYPARLKGIGCLNVDNVEEACQELEWCATKGLAGVFIPTSPMAGKPYRDPIYDRLWWTAQDTDIPLLLHITTTRGLVPGCEDTINLDDMTPSGRTTLDHWVRYSLTAMIFARVFERYPRLKVGSVEHEMSWVPYWLKQMDFIYRERPYFTKGWKSKEGLLPSDFWHRNMFVEIMEDDYGMRFRDIIGVDNILWGSDFPHGESTWPRSMEFLDRLFENAPDEERQKITSENAKNLFGFAI